MEVHKSPPFKQHFKLQPVQLDQESEITALISQRHICGWNYEREVIANWHDQIQRGTRFMWWIMVTTDASTSNDQQEQQQQQEYHKAGHVALVSEITPADPELAQLDRSILTVSSFFILPQYRKGGLGRATWAEVEERARQIPECKQIVIDTLSKRYIYDDSPEWGGKLHKHPAPRSTLVNEDWYTRMGYTKFKEAPRYGIPGTDDLLVAVFMRKYIK